MASVSTRRKIVKVIYQILKHFIYIYCTSCLHVLCTVMFFNVCFVVFLVLFCFLHHSIIEPSINKPPPSWYCSLYTWKGLFCITTPAKSPREKTMIIRLILPWLQYMVVYFFAVAHWLFFSILCKHNKPVLEFSLFRIFKKWLNLTYMYSETIIPKNSVDLGYSKRMLRLRLNST